MIVGHTPHEGPDGLHGWELFPWVLVRFASVPRSAVARTRLTRTLTAARRALALQRAAAASADRLSSRLHAAVPRLAPAARRQVLSARRAIHHLGVPSGTEWIDRVAEVDADVRRDLDAWMALHRELTTAESDRDAIYARELAESERNLWSLLDRQCFQRGLSAANPRLAERLNTLRGRTVEQLASRERAWRTHAIRYLHRSALKPTPFGFFAGVAAAEMGDRNDAVFDVSRLVAAPLCDWAGDRAAARVARRTGTAGIEDAVHPAVLRFRHELFSGFLDDLVSHGATVLCPGLLPEQDGLARFFIGRHGMGGHVPVLDFFHDFAAERRSRRFDHLPIHTAAVRLGEGSGARLGEAEAPLAEAVRRALAAGDAKREVRIEPDLSPFASWEKAASIRLSMLLTPGPGGLSHSRFGIRLWGADRMSLYPRYAAALTVPVPDIVADLRRFMDRWPDVADLETATDAAAVDCRPAITDRTIDVPGCRPGANAVALRDLWVDVDRATGRLVLNEAGGSNGRVTPVFLGVSVLPSRPPLYQFLEILGGRRVSAFELLIRAVSRVLGEEDAWRSRGFVKYVPSIGVGDHIVLSPEMVRIETSAMPHPGSQSPRESFLRFHEWWDEHGLPWVVDVHVPRGSMWVDVGTPDGVRSFHGHIRGADRVHLLLPHAPDGDSLRSVDGESHEVEFALEIDAGARGCRGSAESRADF